MHDVTMEFTPTASSPGGSGQYKNHDWDFFAMTFEKGEIIGYYASVTEESVHQFLDPHPELCQTTISPSTYGVSVGSKICVISPSNDYEGNQYEWNFVGALDQVGMFNYALTPQEIQEFFTITKTPAKVDYIREGKRIYTFN